MASISCNEALAMSRNLRNSLLPRRLAPSAMFSNAVGRSLPLVRQSVLLRFRQPRDGGIREHGQRPRMLPCFEIFEVPHGAILPSLPIPSITESTHVGSLPSRFRLTTASDLAPRN